MAGATHAPEPGGVGTGSPGSETSLTDNFDLLNGPGDATLGPKSGGET